MFINNVAKMSHIYVLEIYFVDNYDGALHYYSITALSSLCHYVIVISHLGSPFHCQVLSKESRRVIVIQSARLGQVHIPVSYNINYVFVFPLFASDPHVAFFSHFSSVF